MHRMRSFPKKYQKYQEYCDNMAKNGKAASQLELQVIADICFSKVECYSTKDFSVPRNVIQPLRFPDMFECKGRIRLLVQDEHCLALFDQQAPPLIRNIFYVSEILREEEKDHEIED